VCVCCGCVYVCVYVCVVCVCARAVRAPSRVSNGGGNGVCMSASVILVNNFWFGVLATNLLSVKQYF